MTPKSLLGSGAGAQDSAREARRFLAAHVRNDWKYPSIAESEQSATPPQRRLSQVTDGTNDSSDDQTAASTWQDPTTQPLNFQPVAWREREYSYSDSASVHSDTDAMDVDTATPAHSSNLSADAQTGAARQESKKRKRAQVLQEEMAWNTGVAHFIAERDAWTCARVPPAPQPNDTTAGAEAGAARTLCRTSDDSLNSSNSTHSTLSTPASSPPPPDGSEVSTTLDLRLPIPEPILKDNPVRAKVRPNAYNEIYSKIIMQCRTPTVPINLQDVVSSCVSGWIAEGNWPPKPGPPDPLMGRAKRNGERHPHFRKGVVAVSRVFGLGANDNKDKR